MTKNAINRASAVVIASTGFATLKTIDAMRAKNAPIDTACFTSVIGHASTSAEPIRTSMAQETEARKDTTAIVSLLSKLLKMFFMTSTAFAIFLLPTILYTINLKKSSEVMA